MFGLSTSDGRFVMYKLGKIVFSGWYNLYEDTIRGEGLMFLVFAGIHQRINIDRCQKIETN